MVSYDLFQALGIAIQRIFNLALFHLSKMMFGMMGAQTKLVTLEKNLALLMQMEKEDS